MNKNHYFLSYLVLISGRLKLRGTYRKTSTRRSSNFDVCLEYVGTLEEKREKEVIPSYYRIGI